MLSSRFTDVGAHRARDIALDAVAVLLLWGIIAVDLATRPLAAGQSVSTVTAYLLAGAISVPFAVHRRFPVVATVLSDLALIAYALDRFTAFPGYATFALVFGVGLHVGRVRALIVYLLGAAGLIIALTLQPSGVATASSWISTVLTVTVAWLAGENLRARRLRRELELAEAQRLAQQRADEGRRAVGEERLRIARDLHDVVAHSMSVIAVQAGVAHHVIDERPELVQQLRAAGLRVDVQHLDDTGGLPAALDISAYRVVQEGLTNVLRHGGPVARLTIRLSPVMLLVEISDTGRAQGGSAPHPAELNTAGSGHGLTGIRERAALFGGTVEAGPLPEAGFRLVVELPLGPSVAAR